jgi:dihydrofolate reductase
VRSIVVAFGENRGIGYRGALPWRLPSDLRRFRELTLGGTVLMGRRTFESLPEAFRPLPQRRNLVLSTTAGLQAPGAEVFASLAAALEACGEDCFVIGGGSIYEQTLPLAERVYATLVRSEPISDTFFPQLEPGCWRCSECSEELHENGHTFRFAVFDRRAQPSTRSA